MAVILSLLAVIAGQLALLYLATGYVNRVAYDRLGKTLYLAFMFPGVVVHELSHLVGCWLSRTKVHEVKLFSPREEGRGRLVLGYVSHDMPAHPFAAGMIGAAPFFGGAAVLWLLFILAFPGAEGTFAAGLRSGLDGLGAQSFLHFMAAVIAARWNAWQTYVALYAAISVSAHVAPSRDDLRFALEGLAAVFVLFIIVAFGVTRSGLVGEHAFASAVSPKLAAVAALLACGLAGVVVATVFFAVLGALVSPFAGRRHGRKKRR